MCKKKKMFNIFRPGKLVGRRSWEAKTIAIERPCGDLFKNDVRDLKGAFGFVQTVVSKRHIDFSVGTYAHV